jgi:beta-N-acetylhexosaminidase
LNGRVRRITAKTALALTALTCVACSSGKSFAPSAGKPDNSTPTTSAPLAGSSAKPTPTASATTSAPLEANPGGLTNDEMVGQLFVGYAYGSSATKVTEAEKLANLALYGAATPAAIVRKWHLGGIILFGVNDLDPARPRMPSGNVNDATQIRSLTEGLQAAATADSGVPLLIGTDQEGGNVQRIDSGVDAHPAQADIAGEAVDVLTCDYYRLGRQLRALGVNQDYAPVADVLRVGSNVIGNRSFGPDAGLVATDTKAAVAGLQAGGVLATVKHWPGHGDVSADSHVSLPVLPQSLAEWTKVDRVPFAAAAPTAASIMVGHLAFPAVDATKTPAPFSSALVDGALRKGLSYKGLVITDSLWMQPARDQGTPAKAALMAVKAGVDMLLMSPDVPGASLALRAQVDRDPSFRAKVQQAVARILAAKQRTEQPPKAPSGC